MKYCAKCLLPLSDGDEMQCIAAEGGAIVWAHTDCVIAKSIVVAKGVDIKKYGGVVPSGDLNINDNIIGDIND